jgi:hypothetical protein
MAASERAAEQSVCLMIDPLIPWAIRESALAIAGKHADEHVILVDEMVL